MKKRFVTLTLDNPGNLRRALHVDLVARRQRSSARRRRAAWGYRVGKSIALGMLRSDLAVPGAKVEVEIFGERFAATVQEDKPLWDPENARLRG